MSDDWKPGDLAQVIKPPTHPLARGMKLGGVYLVEDTYYGAFQGGGKGVGLVIGGHYSDHPKRCWACTGFKKVDPLTSRERDEFLTDLEFDLDVVALQEMYRR